MNILSEFESYLKGKNYSDRYIHQLLNNTERIIRDFGDSITLDDLRSALWKKPNSTRKHYIQAWRMFWEFRREKLCLSQKL